MTTPDHIRAHEHCSHHRDEILASERCGCIYCVAIFTPAEIRDWVREADGIGDEGHTALCPICGIDSVIGSDSGHPISTAFLQAMNAHWFAGC